MKTSDKTEICKRFNNAYKTYDEAACIQRKAAILLIEHLFTHHPNFVPDSILDVGTGTGNVVELLNNRLMAAQNALKTKYTLNDISEDMLSQALKKLGRSGVAPKDIKINKGDMEMIGFENHDLVISNFALQWSDCIKTSIKKLNNISGVFAFSCLLEGTFCEWHSLIDIDLAKRYPNTSEMLKIIEECGVKKVQYLVHDFEISFENTRSFLKYLKKLGASYDAYGNICLSKIRKLFKIDNKPFNTKYRVFFCVTAK